MTFAASNRQGPESLYKSEGGTIGQAEVLMRRLDRLAEKCHSWANFAKAEVYYLRSLEIKSNLLGETNPRLVPTLRKAGILYRINGKFAEAEGLFNRALKIVESAEDPDSLERAKFLNYLAGSYNAQGKFAAAEDCFKKSLAIYEQDESLERFYLAAILFALALVCQRQNKLDESNRFNEKAKIVVESEIGGNVPRLSRRLLSIAQIYFAQEDFDKAELLLRQ